MKPSPHSPLVRRPVCATAVLLAALLVIVLQGALTQAHAGASYYWSNFAGYPGGFGNVDGSAANARFGGPEGICADGSGNFYIADQDPTGSGNGAIRKISSSGEVSTLVPAEAGYAPNAVAVDGSGNVYFLDANTTNLDVVSSTGGAVNVFVNGLDSGFGSPTGIALDGLGNIYVADSAATTVWVVDSLGDVNTLSTNFFGPVSIAYDRQTGTLLVGDNDGTNGYIDEVTLGGEVTVDATIYDVNPAGIAVDGSGNVYCSDSINDGLILVSLSGGTGSYVAPINPNGFGGYVNGPAANAQFSTPEGIAADSSGNIYVADNGNGCIREYNSFSSFVTTFAGAPPANNNRDGANVIASFGYPDGVAVDGTGNILVADASNQDIRKVSNTGLVSTLVSPSILTSEASNSAPAAIAVDSAGNAYVADSGASVIWKVTAGGSLSLFAGGINVTGTNDGAALSAQFNTPSGVAVDGSGNVYVADSGNNTIRVITSGTVRTLAGQPGVPGLQDGVGSGAQFDDPQGITVNASGTVYVADSGNSAIRLVSRSGSTQTNYASGYLSQPSGIALDGSGGFFASDASDGEIYDVSSDGSATLLAGSVTYNGSVDGVGTSASGNLLGLAIDPRGNVDIADGYGSIRQMTRAGAVSTLAGFANPTGIVPSAVAVDGSDNLLVFNPTNEDLIRINPSGIGAVVSPGAINDATALAVDGKENIFAMEGAALSGSLVELAPSGSVSVKATQSSIEAIAPLSGSQIRSIFDYIALDANDNIYGSAFASEFGPRGPGVSYLYKVSTTGSASLIVSGSTYVGSPLTLTNRYGGLALDSSGDIYFANLYSVQEIASGSTTPTIYAGSTTSGTANGIGGLAQFGSLAGLALDGSNNIYVADSGNLTVREIVPGGTVSTIGGTPGTAGGANGVGAAASFGSGGINGPGLGAIAAAADGSAVYLVDDRVARGLSGTNFVTPTLSPVSIASSGVSGTSAIIGNTITVSFTSSTAIQTPIVTIGGSPATVVDVSGNSWKASIIVGSETLVGPVTFDISFQSLPGISGVDVTTTTDGSRVTVQPPPPSLPYVSIASTDALSSTEATIGETINLTFTSNVPINAPQVTIAGQSATVGNNGGNTWQASITVGAGTPLGRAAFSIGNLTSTLGISGTGGAVTATTDGSHVTIIPPPPPSLTIVSISSNDLVSSTQAIIGDEIDIYFTSNVPIIAPVVTIAGQAAAVSNNGGNTWQASIIVGDATPVGPVAFSIGDLTSTLGTSGTTVTATTDGSQVTVTPSLLDVSIASTDTENNGSALPGDTIYLLFTANAPINTPTVTIDSQTAAVTYDGSNSYTASIVVSGTDVPNYPVPFVISFQSTGGVAGIPVSSVTDNSSVSISGPGLEYVSIASDDPQAGLARAGDTVSLIFTGNEPITPSSVSIAGHTVVPVNEAGNTWKASVVLAPGDIHTTPYVAPFDITYTSAAVGSGTASQTQTTDASSVLIANNLPAPTLPSVFVTGGGSVGSNITVNFESSEAILLPSVTIAGRAAHVTYESGNYWSGSISVTPADIMKVTGTYAVGVTGTVPFSIQYQNTLGVSGSTYNGPKGTDGSVALIGLSAPQLSDVTIASNSALGQYEAEPGDVVTLAFDASGPITSPTVSILGRPATVVHAAGNTYSAAATVTGTDPLGNIYFNIAFKSGTAPAVYSNTTDGSSVTIVAPTLDTVSIYSSDGNPTIAKPGEKVTLAFTSSEPILTPTVTIANTAASVSSIGASGTNWTASITVSGTDSNGPVGFNIAYKNTGGAVGTPFNGTTDGSSVDITAASRAPTLYDVSIASNGPDPTQAAVGDAITLTFRSSTAIATPAVAIAGRAATVASTGSNLWSAAITVLVSDTAASPVAFTVDFQTATGGIPGVEVSTTSDGSSVSIVPNIAPSLTSVSIGASNGSNVANPGDAVGITFTADRRLATPSVEIAGRTATVLSEGDDTWYAYIVVTGSDPLGPVPFVINFTSLGGLAGEPVEVTTDGSSVAISGPPAPQLQNVSIQSSDANPEYAAAGDTITLRIISQYPIEPPAVTIAGRAATVSGAGTVWTGSIKVTGSDPTGPTEFTIEFQNTQGAPGAPVNQTYDGSSVTIGPAASDPTLYGVTIYSNHPGDNTQAVPGDSIILRFTSSEAIHIPDVTINNLPADVSSLGDNKWQAELLLGSGTGTGEAPFSIAYETLSGSTSGTVTATTDFSNVIIPPENVPVIDNVFIGSSDPDPSYATVGDVISVTFNTTTAVQLPQVAILGRTATVTQTGTSNIATFVATVTVTGSDPFGAPFFTIDTQSTAGIPASTFDSMSDYFGGSVTVGPSLTQPSLVDVTLSSNNYNSTIAQAGDVITLGFTSNLPLKQPRVSIENRTATVTGTGTSWSATITVTGSDALGNVPFTIDFTSVAGVAGVEVNQTSDFSAVSIVPAVPPMLPNVSIASSDTDDYTEAAPGGVITLYITADVALKPPTVTIAGQSAVVTGFGSSYTASIIVSGSAAQGLAPFNITFQSSTGIAGVPVTETTDGTYVTIVAPPAPELELSLHGPVPGAGGSATTFQTFGTTEPDSFYGTEKLADGKKLKGLFGATGNLILSATSSGGYKAFGQPNGDADVATNAEGKPVILTGLLSGTATPATFITGSPAIKSILAIDGYLNSSEADTFFLASVSGIKGVSTALGVVRSGSAYFIAANNEKLGGGTVSKLTTFTTSPGTPAQGRWRGDDFTFGVRVTFKGGAEAVYLIPDTTTPITTANFATLSATDWMLYGGTGAVGNSIPGLPGSATIKSLGLPGFGGSYFGGYGTTEAHIVNLKHGATISGANDAAIVSGNTVIARKGSAAPNINGDTAALGPFYQSLSDPVCGAYGDIAYEATLFGAGVKASNNSGIWYQPTDEGPYLVARTGSVAPGANGAKFSGFTSMVLPSYNFGGDGPVFVAKLTGTNVNSANNVGLWAVNSFGIAQLLLRTGGAVEVNGTSETLHSFTALVAEPGASGAASGYDAEGNIAVYATFKDGTHALLDIATP